jgi:hypothetical protein
MQVTSRTTIKIELTEEEAVELMDLLRTPTSVIGPVIGSDLYDRLNRALPTSAKPARAPAVAPPAK